VRDILFQLREIVPSSFADRASAAFAVVHHREYWFWIDVGDVQTKRALTAVMFFFTLAETGGNEKLPLITIGAQWTRSPPC
jgi:hypothetical protein